MSETEEHLKPLVLKDSLIVNFKVLLVCGWWPPDTQNPRKLTIYKCYRVFILLTTYVITMFTEVTTILLSLDDLEKLSSASFLFMSHLAESFKLYYFLTKYDDLRALLNSLQRENFKPRNRFQYMTIANTMRNSSRFYISVLLSCVFCVVFMGMYPILETMGTDQPMRLPMVMWYPFETDYSPLFEIIYVYQFVAALANAFSDLSVDGTFSSYMAHICAQLDNLNHSLQNIMDVSQDNLNMQKGSTSSEENTERTLPLGPNGLVTIELQEELDKRLVNCIEHHRDILQFNEELGRLFTYSIIGQVFLGSVILCISLFQLTLVKFNSLQFHSMLVYELCILWEIFLYFHYSNEIILKSQKLPLSAYESNWIYCSIKYKKSLLYFMHCTQKPIQLYAGNLFVLSLETYLMILRSAWSYFLVLRSVHEE